MESAHHCRALNPARCNVDILKVNNFPVDLRGTSGMEPPPGHTGMGSRAVGGLMSAECQCPIMILGVGQWRSGQPMGRLNGFTKHPRAGLSV